MHMFDNPAAMTEEGVFVDSNWLRLSEILHDFDPYMELRWIPPQNRTSPTSKPYAICHCLPNRNPYVILFASELDDPVQILATLWEGKVQNGNILNKLDAIEKAKEAFRLKQNMEELEDLGDQYHFLLTNRSPWVTRWKRPDGTIIKLDTATGKRVG